MDGLTFGEMLKNLVDYSWIIGLFAIFGAAFALFRRVVDGPVCTSKASLLGKTVIVTGSNTGLGKETARDFVRRGGRVILACRNMQKAHVAAREIDPAGPGVAIPYKLDLSSFKSIHAFVEEFNEKETRLDVLVNNAGVGLQYEKKTTEDGNDFVWQTNHLGPFLLTNLLLDKLKANAPARVVILSSYSHRTSPIFWDDVNLDKPGSYGFWKAYGQSKLGNVLFSIELARRLKGTAVTTYAIDPGSVRTDIFNDVPNVLGSLLAAVGIVFRLFFFKSTKQGAQTSIYCSVSEDCAHQSGFLYKECSILTPHKRARDRESQRRLWDLSMEMVGLDVGSKL